MRYISRLLGQDSSPQVQPDQTAVARGRFEWYLSGKEELRAAMRLLNETKQQFLSLGRIDERWYVPLDNVFGPQFRELLTKWMPSNPTAVMLANQLTRHAKTFRSPLPPPFDQERSSAEEGGNKAEVILDPQQSKQMVVKLFEVQQSMLSDRWRSAEQRASSAAREQNDASDPPRQLQRGVPRPRSCDRSLHVSKGEQPLAEQIERRWRSTALSPLFFRVYDPHEAH
jgi:hypothetical protein